MDKSTIGKYTPRVETGLGEADAAHSRETHGDNSIGQGKVRGFFPRVFDELKNPVTKILLLALGANIGMIFYGGSIAETVGIAASVLISTVVAVVSEIGSDKAFSRICEESERTTARVLRDGEIRSLYASDIVVGDIVLLGAGERVAADGYLISGALSVDNSALNGESREKRKTPASSPSTLSPEDGHSLLRGALVTEGGGKMKVCRVGKNTLYGSMAHELSQDTETSPLKERLTKLSKQISRIGVCGALVVIAADFIPTLIKNGFSLTALLHSLMLGISLLVVAVPEGLPMMITVVLASNMKRMSRAGVLVRRLVGIETAGSIDILFCDKTGTLTRGKMNAVSFISGDTAAFSSFSSLPDPLKPICAASFVLNADAAFTASGIRGGNATERAVLKFAGKEAARYTDNMRITEKIPFNSAKRYSSTKLAGKSECELIKGAPEVILSLCDSIIDKGGTVRLSPPGSAVSRIIDEAATEAGRMLAFAVKKDGHTSLLGLMRIEDTPRREARGAVERLKKAGVSVVMVTGDDPRTALAVARKCGLADGRKVITGASLAELTDEEAKALLPDLCVVARALPGDKSRLVRIARAAGCVPAMTGDGVNDAPALRAADVGFAMGSGSEVAKQAGDIVILDDNIASIERAVLYGRTILSSIRKFIVFQLTVNFCAMALCIAAPFLPIDTPVTVTQMLWMNLIMDSLGGLAFAGEPSLKAYMNHPPVKRSESIITKEMVVQTAAMTLWSLVCMAAFFTLWQVRATFVTYEEYVCGFFNFFVLCGIANAFNARAPRLNLFAGLRKNKAFVFIMGAVFVAQVFIVCFGGRVFRCVPLGIGQWKACVCLALCVIPPELVRKLLVRLTPGKG